MEEVARASIKTLLKRRGKLEAARRARVKLRIKNLPSEAKGGSQQRRLL